MRDLPTGTLTFFFSDIEGSTRLLEALGDRYAKLLERHRTIVRTNSANHDATEVGTQGDSFFLVFAEAPAAVRASVEIQRAMAVEAWPADSALKIRVGLHTGEARVVAGDYVGLDVHRAARIMAAAHGGEIVASAETCADARATTREGIELRDLGEHRLRDLSAPERLYQVIASGLETDFPPLRTLDRTPNNLPTQPTALIGRDNELERIRRHLESSRVRILTLTGPGGIGKTRLALQAAANQVDRVTDGIWFVDLTRADDAPGALREIAQTLGATVRADDDLRTTIAGHVGDRELLLILDNFEQVMDAADEVAELLRLCPHLRVIVTSRESLRVRGEQLIEVAPLTCPDPGPVPPAVADLARYEAIRLFVERASAARDDFSLTDENAAVIAEICTHLDGLPLAIELAAARLRLFSVEELRDRLRAGLGVLRGGARDLPERQRTLASTIAWSFDLLDEDERAVFQLLSVFPSADIASVESVAATLDWLAHLDVVDVLASLVDKSLVRGTANGRGQRLGMLETIREFASEQLTRDARADQARDAHAVFFAEFAAHRGRALSGQGREEALNEIRSELDNILAAWHSYVDRADFGRLHALLDVLWPFYETRGWYQGALALLNDLLAVMATVPTTPARQQKELTLRIAVARVLLAIQGYTDEVERLYREAIALAEASGAAPTQLSVLRSLASFYLYRGEIDKTVAMGEKVMRLAEKEQDPGLAIEGHMILGPSRALLGDWRAGLDHLDSVIDGFEPDRQRASRLLLGPNPGVAAAAVSALLHWTFALPETADRKAAQALEFAERLGHPYSRAYATFHVGILDLWRGRPDDARRHGAEVQAIAAAKDYLIWQATGLVLEGTAMALLGETTEGRARVERGVALYREHPTPPVFWPLVLSFRAMAALQDGASAEALALLDEAAAIAPPRSSDHASIQVQRADVLLGLGDDRAAEAALRASIASARASAARATELIAATRLAERFPERRAFAVESIARILPELTEGLETESVRRARSALEIGLVVEA